MEKKIARMSREFLVIYLHMQASVCLLPHTSLTPGKRELTRFLELPVSFPLGSDLSAFRLTACQHQAVVETLEGNT